MKTDTNEQRTQPVNRRDVLKLGAATVSLTALAGCSGGDSGDGTTTQEPTTTGDQDTSTPSSGGTTTGPTGSAIESRSLRLGLTTPEGAVHSQWAREFLNYVDEQSDGKISFDPFYNSQLGTTVEHANQTRTGSIDMTIVPMGPIFRDFNVFKYPYTYDGFEQFLRGVDPESSQVMRDMLPRMAEEANVRYLGMTITGVRHVSLNSTQACAPADLEGLDIRSPALELYTKTVEGLGANPVNIDVTELVSSLSSGSIAGQENPLNIMQAYGLEGVQQYVIMTGHMIDGLPAYMNYDVWDEMSEEAQQILLDGAEEASEWMLNEMQTVQSDARTYLENNGMTFVTEDGCLDKEGFRTSVRDTVDSAFPEWAELASKLENV